MQNIKNAAIQVSKIKLENNLDVPISINDAFYWH